MEETAWQRDFQLVRGRLYRHSHLCRDWFCRCGSKLVTRFKDGWVTECAANPKHDADGWFITKAAAYQEKVLLATYQLCYDRRIKEIGGDMSFVKDRNDDTGIVHVRRAGRISLGQKRDDSGALALPFFRFKPYEDGIGAQALLAQVQAAVEKYAPGQDPDKPKVLPVYFPADSVDLFASSAYKLVGKDGHPRCTGDGEYIQFKLGGNNLLEISDGVVRTAKLMIDGKQFSQGTAVPCPGRSRTGRWEHCEKCRLMLSLDLQIAGLPYIWTLTTGDQAFYKQFMTILQLCDYYVRRGVARFLSDIPLLLRREEGIKARPRVDAADDVYLTWQRMPALSIEINPAWLWQVEAKIKVLPVLESDQTLQPALPIKKRWYDRVKETLPDRPWPPETVKEFVERGIEESIIEAGGDQPAKPAHIKMIGEILERIYAKTLEAPDLEKAVDAVFRFLLGGRPETNARCAVIWRWANDDQDGNFSLNTYFEQEALQVLEVAFKEKEV